MVKEFFIECHQRSTKANLESPQFWLEGKVRFSKKITKSCHPNHLNTYPTRHEYFLEELTSCRLDSDVPCLLLAKHASFTVVRHHAVRHESMPFLN